MKITLGKVGETPVDVTDYLIADDGTECDQELERQAFQRSHSDMSFHFSDMDNFFRKLLLQELSARWEIIKRSNRNIFIGEIENSSIRFNGDDQDVQFTAWSKNKIFWDWAKSTKINKKEYYINTIMSITGALEFNLLKSRNPACMENLYQGIYIHPSFAYNSGVDPLKNGIRWFANSTTYGNMGKYYDLHPDTKIADLLEGFAIHYNAEFYIDPDTNLLSMMPRMEATSDVDKEISDIILTADDEDGFKPEISPQDGNKVDWLKVHTLRFEPPPVEPVFTNFEPIWYNDSTENPVVLEAGKVGFRFSYILTNGTNQYETPLSFVLDTGIDLRTLRNNGHYAERGTFYFNIPKSTNPSGYTVYDLKIYRANLNSMPWTWKWNGGLRRTGYYDTKITEYSSYYSIKIIILNYSLSLLDPVPMNDALAPLYLSFDEAANSWSQSDEQPASSKGLEINSKLKFVDVDPNNPTNFIERTNQGEQSYYFFCRDNNYATLIERWKPVCSSRPLLHCAIRSDDIRLNDPVKYSNLEYNLKKRFIVRRAISKSEKEISEIYAVAR